MPILESNAIHLWQIDLQADEAVIHAYAALLSPDETVRAQRFRGSMLSKRYTVAHGAMRSILASYLSTHPKNLPFTFGAQGKPSLQSELLSFNLSHSRDRAALAITPHSRIGVDIEHIEAKRDLLQIAATHFSPAEASAVTSLEGNARTQAFYACWTAKEAYLKAISTGLATPLDSFEFVFPPIAPANLIRVGSSPVEHLRWETFAFTLDSCAVTIVVEGKDHVVHHRTWQP